MIKEKTLTHQHEFLPYDEDSGLEYCKKCMGFEGSMPTDCPEEAMNYDVSQKVYAGNLDFRKGEGWVNGLSPMGFSMAQSMIIDMMRGREGSAESDAEIIIRLGTTRHEYNKVKQHCLEYLYK